MATIRFGADFSQVETEAAKMTAQLQKVSDRIKEVISVTNRFNEAGVLVGATVKGITKDGKEFTAQLALLSKFQQQLAAAGKDAGALAVAGISYKNTTERAKELTDQVSKLNEIGARVARTFQYFVTYKAFNFVNDQIQTGIKSAKDFQIQLSLIRTISQDNQQSFAAFGKQVRQVSDESGFDVNDVAKAFYNTTSNQIAKGANVAPFVQSASELARVTGSELPDAVNLLSSAINAYGLSAKDATQISAVFFRTIDEGRVVASELANTFGRVGVLGANLGVSMEDLNAVLAITTQKGFKTTDAMTLLTNLLIKLEKPTEATKNFFASLGVDSGEAAIKLLGFNGVLRKMVESVQSGQSDVSAFFDEIRGRKQFGVFQQSIDEIENFSNRLKDTTDTMRVYQKAIEIRGESPADLLVKETNKLANIFKVDLGQAVIETTASIIKFFGGVDAIKNITVETTTVMKALVATFVAYRLTTLGATAANAGFVGSLTAVGAAAGRAIVFLAPFVTAYLGFKAGQAIFRSGEENLFGKIDPANLNATADALERVVTANAKLKADGGKALNPFAGLEQSSKIVSDSFKGALQFVANANKVNDKFLNDARDKSKEVAEAVRIGFAGFTDIVKSNISEIKKGITEAKNEIEKSSKSLLKYKESLDDIIFNTQLKYANDQLGEQKIRLADERIKSLTSRAAELFKQGTPESVDQARKLFDEIAKLEADNFDRRTDLQKGFFEEALKNDPSLRNPDGPNVFTVQTTELQKKLNGLLQLRNQLEADYTKNKQVQVDQGGKQLAFETERLRKLESALKQFEQLDPLNKEGKVKSEFRDQSGKFDPQKLKSEVAQLENKIREAAGDTGSFQERVQLELLLTQKKKALVDEAVAQERSEYLKTAQSKLLSEEDLYKKKIENLRRERQEAIELQTQLRTAIGQKPSELAGFANIVGAGGGLKDADKDRMARAINSFKKSLELAVNDLAEKDGVKIIKPENIEEALLRYKEAVKVITETRDKAGRAGALELTDQNGRTLTPGGGIAAFEQQFEELKNNANKLFGNLGQEKAGTSFFDETIKKPLEGLKAQFPELAGSADTATKAMNNSFRDLANGGVQDLINQLKEVQRLMQPGMKISAVVGDDGLAYAASGGIAGRFPGQPRGSDIYPIWAAKDEFIVNAQSSRAYRPMLEAINNRRFPGYMAAGGVVGGDTMIGDINVTVNGAKTNSDTGRAIGNSLERQLRRKQIRLDRRR